MTEERRWAASGGGALRLDDVGVVQEADAAAAALLGCRIRDLIGKPFVVFVGESLRRPLFGAIRDMRSHGEAHRLHGELASRDPVQVRATIELVPSNGGIAVTIGDAERRIDPDRLTERLRVVRDRQHALADTLDAVMRHRRATPPDLDVGAEPAVADAPDALTPALHDWRLLPSGDLLLLVVAAHGQQLLHRELARAVRETVRALVLAGTPPGELFTRVEGICGLRSTGPIASTIAAYCTPNGSRTVVTSAGGTPPLVRRSDGTVETLASHGPPLGSYGHPVASPASTVLTDGDALILHVDGNLEGAAGSAWFERRLRELDPRSLGGAETARQLMDRDAAHGTSSVLCAVRGVVATTSRLPGDEVRIGLGRAEMRDVGRSRRELSTWLERRAVRAETIERALIVLSELATNAVAAASDRAELRIRVARGAVLLEVSDDGGSWHPEAGIAPVSDGGLGLRVASSLCDDLHIASSAAGTVIRARVGTRPMR